MKNIDDAKARALAERICEIVTKNGGLPRDFYIEKTEIVSEVWLDLSRLDRLYRPGPASFSTYALNFCPKRVIKKIWAQYRKIERLVVLEDELEDGELGHAYGEYDAKPLTVQPDYDGIELRDALDQLEPEERLILRGRLDGRTQSEIAAELGVSQKTVNKKIEKIFKKLQNPEFAE